MNIYTVSFFGHRHISKPFVIEERLDIILHDLITKKEYIEFLVGRDGEFDQLVSSAIKRAKEKYAYGNVSHILVLPYLRADYRDNKESFEQYYDEVQICAESQDAYPKAAIEVRNRAMVDKSDMVICYVERRNGGAWTAVNYAKKQGKRMIDLAKEGDDNARL